MARNIQDIAYGKYQLDWMQAHGYTVSDIVKELAEYAKDQDGLCTIDSLFSEWEYDRGFGGAVWVCKEEFLGAEYLNVPYMESLLTDDEFDAYLEDTKEDAGLDGLVAIIHDKYAAQGKAVTPEMRDSIKFALAGEMKRNGYGGAEKLAWKAKVLPDAKSKEMFS